MSLARTFLVAATLWSCASGMAMAQDKAGNLCSQFAGTAHTQPSPEVVAGASASYVYKTAGKTGLRIHLFRPDAAATTPRPAVIFFFGGGWMTGNVGSFTPQARHAAERGATAILADYRTFCRNGTQVDAGVADAADAVRWVRAHARDLGIDPKRIAVSGGSSGGHLALTTAVFGGRNAAGTDSAPDLLVLFYPCVDLTSEVEQEFSSEAIGRHGKRLSPQFHVGPGLPRTYIFQGTADPLYEEVRTYCARASAAGNQCEMTEYTGAGHGFFNAATPAGARWYSAALDAMDKALTREGWLVARPTDEAD